MVHLLLSWPRPASEAKSLDIDDLSSTVTEVEGGCQRSLNFDTPRITLAQCLRGYGTNGSIDQPYGRTAKSLLHITSDVIVSGMYPCENTRASTDGLGGAYGK